MKPTTEQLAQELTQQVTRRLGQRVSRWRSDAAPGAPRGAAIPGQRRPVTLAGPPGSDAVVRRRQPRDLPSCTRLVRGVGGAGMPGQPIPAGVSARDWLVDGVHEAWVAERRGLVLGHVALAGVGAEPRDALRWREVTGREPERLGAVSRFFVREADRGRGLGGLLLDLAAAEARDRGLLPVCEVLSDDRYGVALLERHGWRQVGRFPHSGGRTTYLSVLPAPDGTP